MNLFYYYLNYILIYNFIEMSTTNLSQYLRSCKGMWICRIRWKFQIVFQVIKDLKNPTIDWNLCFYSDNAYLDKTTFGENFNYVFT